MERPKREGEDSCLKRDREREEVSCYYYYYHCHLQLLPYHWNEIRSSRTDTQSAVVEVVGHRIGCRKSSRIRAVESVGQIDCHCEYPWSHGSSWSKGIVPETD